MAALVAGLPAGLLLVVAIVELRTNAVARWLGDHLVATNRSRPASGELWTRIAGRRRARQTLADTTRALDSASRPRAAPGLPRAVHTRSFRMFRVPESGLPNLLVLLVRPEPGERATDAARLATAFRLFQVARRVLSVANVAPDAYYGLISQRADGILAAQGVALGRTGPADADQDSLAVDAQVSETVRSAVADVVLAETRERVLQDYDAGRIRQVLISRAFDDYDVEILFDSPDRPPIRMRVSTDAVAGALGLTAHAEAAGPGGAP